MQLLEKTAVNLNICSIELAFNGNLLPSAIPDWQPFYNSTIYGTDFTKTYVGLGSVSFSEESEVIAAGAIYKQKVSIVFPNADGNRSQRIALMQRVRFVKLNLSDGSDFIIGRNDFKQNARPRIKVSSNLKKAGVEFETVSIFPCGFVQGEKIVELPQLIPLILI
ncbi:hypothetical protein [Flavobacterium denitrificans]|uniref:hypothetical protein n=1 Tax=Flavobacterium denitrificans TaxID=281361 RepID=UPI000421130B|nr:hypothetical protein [Flavobacterium denitrificans]